MALDRGACGNLFVSRLVSPGRNSRGERLFRMTFRYPNEVRDEQPYFEDIAELKLPKDMMDLASQRRLSPAPSRAS